MIDTFANLDWEHPDPFNAAYWQALRAALASRRIALPETANSYSEHNNRSGPGMPLFSGHLLTLLRALRAAQLTGVWRTADDEALPWRAVVDAAGLQAEGWPSAGWPAAAMAGPMRELATAIRQFRYRRVEVSCEGGHWVREESGEVMGSTLSEAITRAYAIWDGSVDAVSPGAMAVSAFKSRGYWGSDDYWHNDPYVEVTGLTILKKAGVINPLSAVATATVRATRHDEQPNALAVFDAFGTGLVYGENTFDVGPREYTSFIPVQSGPPIPDSSDWVEEFDSENWSAGFALSGVALLDYGDHFILGNQPEEEDQ